MTLMHIRGLPSSRSFARHAVLCLAVLLVSGCSDSHLLDDKNPYFLRGVQLLQEHKNEEAIEAFEKCLRINPGAAKAHLQLGMLYEDVRTDPITAIYHYRCYLRARPESENSEAVVRWLGRAERAYLNDLQGRYASAAPSLTEEPVMVPVPSPEREEEKAKTREREEKLLERVKALSGELRGLRQRLHEQAQNLVAKAHEAARETVENVTRKPEEPQEKVHVVEKGDSLSKLARDYYGTLKYWPALRDYNHDVLKGKDVLRPGMELRIPPAEKLPEPP
jgi:nucleoid-associated protein YgaU